jgi:NAD(P)-dependent dehydrogenase (short-subunit alcohol dehydrogenase family)
MVALITGASRGIGRCGALALAARGFDVAITGRTLHEGDGRVGDVVIPGSLDKTFEEVRALGREALPIGMDITERDSILSAYRTVIDTWGHVDALVNNAPYSGPGTDEKLLDIELEHAAALLAGNYLNQLYLTQHQALGADDRFSKGFHGAPPPRSLAAFPLMLMSVPSRVRRNARLPVWKWQHVRRIGSNSGVAGEILARPPGRHFANRRDPFS